MSLRPPRFRKFSGTVTDRIYPEGLHLKLPWNRMFFWETRVQAHHFSLLAFSAEGMPITVEATTLFLLKEEQTPLVQTGIGPDYVERIVAPVSMSK